MNTVIFTQKKQDFRKILLTISLCCMVCIAFAITITSTGTGNWNNAGTWDNGIPTVNDEVIIQDGDNVTSNTAIGFMSVEVESGATWTIAVNTDMTNSTGLITNDGTISKAGDAIIDSDIINNGIFTWGSGSFETTLAPNPTFTNNGTLNIGADSGNTNDIEIDFINKSTGIVNKNGNVGTQTIPSSFTNEANGTVNVIAGRVLQFSGNFTNEGTFDIAGTLTLSGATCVFNNGGVLDGIGTILLEGVIAMSGTGNFVPSTNAVNQVSAEITANSMSMTVPSGTTYTLSQVNKLDGFTSITNENIMNKNGNLTLEDDLINNGTFTWVSGNFVSASGSTLTNQNVLNIQSNDVTVSTVEIFFTNKSGATINLNGAAGKQTIPNLFVNESGATVNIASNRELVLSVGTTHGGLFDIDGTLTITDASNNTVITNANFTNNGEVEVNNNRFLEFAGSTQQSLNGDGTGVINNMEINNPNNVVITATIAVDDKLSLLSGLLLIGENDLNLSFTTLTGGDADTYIVTNGNGQVIESIFRNNPLKTIPIGPTTSSYNPVAFTTTDENVSSFAFRVKTGGGSKSGTNGPNTITFTIDAPPGKTVILEGRLEIYDGKLVSAPAGVSMTTSNSVYKSDKDKLIPVSSPKDIITAGNIIGSSYTKSAWIKIAQVPQKGSNNIISGDKAEHAFFVPSNMDNRLAAGHNGKWDYVKAPNPIREVWHHTAVTYDASQRIMKLYLDGVLVDSENNVPNYKTDEQNKTLIGGYDGGHYFNGSIKNVEIWDKVLSDEQVENIYSSTSGIK